MSKVPKVLIKEFQQLSERVNVGIVAVLDKTGMPIIFTSKIFDFTGYSEQEIIGKTFARLLPLSVRSRHKALMQGFKESEVEGTSRSMSSGRTVKMLNKKGEEVDVSISISYHAAGEPGMPGVFIAMIQDPLNPRASDRELQSLKLDFNSIVYKGRLIGKKAKQALAKKIAASGGALGFTVWLLTQLTPLGTALKGAVAAWGWGSEDKETVGEIGVYEKISPRMRDSNLVLVRNEIQRFYPEVLAVGYLRIDEEDGLYQIKYQSDSSSQKWGEIWFFDSESGQNALILSLDEIRKLRSFECFFRNNGAAIQNAPNRPLISTIYCPTIQIQKVPSNKSLLRFKFSNIVAVAIDPATPISSGTTRFEDITGKLFELQPSIENMELDVR